jgi:hypothetical protein
LWDLVQISPPKKKREKKRIMAPSAISPQRIRVELEKIFLLTNWKLIFCSVRGEGRLIRRNAIYRGASESGEDDHNPFSNMGIY